jgi:hypothetical protein
MKMIDPLFVIPLYYDSPRTFREKLSKKFAKEIKKLNPPEFTNEREEIDFLESRKSHFSSRYPSIHRYNNILGYAELAIEARNIVIYFYLNGDKRKIYNQGVKRRKANTHAIYHSLYMIYGGLVNNSNKEVREAIESVLSKLVEQCAKWNVHVDVSKELELIKYLDFEKMLG